MLGPLIVPPYRSRDGGPLADATGASCAYYTARHHVFVLAQEWSDGKASLMRTRGIGDLAGLVVKDPGAEAVEMLDGAWDDVVAGMDGRVSLLKGDRLLTLSYLTASTDLEGAATLARMALKRLAESK